MNMYEGEFTLEQLNEAYYRLNENYKTILKEEHGEGFTHDKTVDYKTDKKRYSLYSTAYSKLTNNLRRKRKICGRNYIFFEERFFEKKWTNYDAGYKKNY